MTEKDLILKLAHVIRPLVLTHMHWHLSKTQDEVLKDLDELISVLENPVVETTPAVENV